MGNPRSKSVREKFYINAAGEQLVLLNRSIIINIGTCRLTMITTNYCRIVTVLQNKSFSCNLLNFWLLLKTF